jgi:hypothetical protein
MPTSLAQKPHDRGCRFFNRPTRDIDRGPIVSCAKSPRKRNFLGDCSLVDVLIVIAVRLQSEQSIFANLHDTLGARI